jgi:hypothetical protein
VSTGLETAHFGCLTVDGLLKNGEEDVENELSMAESVSSDLAGKLNLTFDLFSFFFVENISLVLCLRMLIDFEEEFQHLKPYFFEK